MCPLKMNIDQYNNKTNALLTDKCCSHRDCKCFDQVCSSDSFSPELKNVLFIQQCSHHVSCMHSMFIGWRVV